MSSAVTNLWRQFVQRRLWPVAILLVAALAAVPMVLTEEPAPAPPAPPMPVSGTEGSDALATQPIVAPAEARTARRKVLGTAKNPFGVPAPDAPTRSTADDTVVNVQNTSGDDDTKSGGTSPSGWGTTPSTPTAPSTPVAPPDDDPKPKPKTYAYGELTVRFGSSEDPQRQSVKRLQPLPSPDEPVLIYMGLLKDGKTAEFMVDHGVVPVGDGECRPSPEECQTVRLRAGETEFFDVTDESGSVTGQYQLDLVKIHKGTGASAAKASRTTKSAASMLRGRPALRSTVGQAVARLP
jgi:hypothetical protein